ncbi:facilitated trehalose transporter Tret1-like [Diachasmimorpha longicaudata]|uniref:facilitated trehalose transporter Tret1-like n=1 Tax=Diachasmimorpha longicaudata TaxID=58733 RepID=UPI0030B8DA5E
MDKSKEMRHHAACTAGSRRLRQTAAAIIANLSGIAGGMLSAWTAPIIPQLEKETTPVGTRPLTQNEISWLGSVTGLTSLIALLFYAVAVKKIGNRIMAWTIAISAASSWLLIYFAQDFYYLLVARGLAGFVCGITFSMIPVYICEIAEDSIRGQLGSFMSFGFNVGTLASFVLGAKLSYHAFALCGLVVPVAFIIGFIFLPESPTHLLRRGHVDRATSSLMWLRSNDKTTVDYELMQIERQLTNNIGKSAGLKDLFRDRGTFMALIISVTLFAGQHTSGYAILFSYTTTIFDKAKCSVDPDLASIIIAVIQIIGSSTSSLTIENLGRRKLVIIACMGMIISHFGFGTFLILQSRHYDLSAVSWLPLVTMSIFALAFCAGLGPLTSTVASEIFSADIVSLGLSVSLSTEFISNFLTTLAFPSMTAVFGMHVSFFILALFTGFTLVIIYFLLPETKGRSKLDIFEELNGQTRKREFRSVPLDEESVEKNEFLQQAIECNGLAV